MDERVAFKCFSSAINCPFGVYLNLFFYTMAYSNPTCNLYGSKSLNAQWEDLSRSVSSALNEHEGPEPKEEFLRQIISTQ